MTGLQWGKVDTTAKANSTLTSADAESYVDLADLAVTIEEPVYDNPCELNQASLDSVKAVLPDDLSSVQWGFVSTALEGAVTLTATFSEAIDTEGVTFYFVDSYPRSIGLKWYSGTTLLDEMDFTPSALTAFCSNSVSGYDSIEMTFDNWLPGQHLKLYKIDWGAIKIITLSEIVTCTIKEGVYQASTTLPVNTLSLSFLALQDDFDIVTNAGEYNLVKTLQPVEDLDGYGTFYIESFEASGHEVSMSLVDILGVIGDVEYLGGFIDMTMTEFVAVLAALANTENIFEGRHNGFELGDGVADLQVTGYLPVTTIREAIQDVAMAYGLTVDTSRGETIKIFYHDSTVVEELGDGDIILGDTVGSSGLYNSVSISSYTYTLDTSSDKKEVIEATYAAGTYTEQFSSPYAQYTGSNCTITDSGANYVTFTVTSAATVTITAYPYEVVESVTTTESPDLRTSDVRKTKSIKNNTFISGTTVPICNNSLYNYYTQSYKVSMQTLTDNLTGSTYTADHVTGMIQTQTLDRVTGLAKEVLYGNYIEPSD